MSKRKFAVVAVVLLLLIIGTVWAVRSSLANSQLEKVKQMREAMAKLPRDQRRWEELGKEMDKLSEAQRDQLRDQRWAEAERRMKKRADDFFGAPPNQRKAVLDKQIADDERRRKERESNRAQGGPGGNLGGPNSGAAGQGAANPGRQPGGPNRSPDARSANRNRRLDNTSPAQRASQAAYAAAMQKRRIELGLPATPPGRPGGGR